MSPDPTHHCRRARCGLARLPLTMLALTICLATTSALAADVMVARIRSLDPVRGTLTVNPVELDFHGNIIRESTLWLTIFLPHSDLPTGIQPGRIVRIWTSAPPDGQGRLTAIRISGMGGGPDLRDATGVRRRLGRDEGSWAGGGGGWGGSGGSGSGGAGSAGGGSGSGAGGSSGGSSGSGGGGSSGSGSGSGGGSASGSSGSGSSGGSGNGSGNGGGGNSDGGGSGGSGGGGGGRR